jgi:DnaK suppressor protein
MKAAKQERFRKLLMAELKRHAEQVGEEHTRALDIAGDDAKESSDLALRDVLQEMALKLGDRESQIVADIDQALMRMQEGTFGMCVRCGHPIDERRLEALPTARYDASCQTEIEAAQNTRARPSL